jgi:hypothetical protein
MHTATELIPKIDQEIFRAHAIHETFFALFDSGDEVIALLDESDGQFFELVYLMYLDAITLSFTRLIDGDKSCGKDNLSFYYLLKRTDLKSHGRHAKWLAELDAVKKRAEAFKKVRNTQVGHLDFVTAVMGGLSPKPSFSKKDIEDVYSGLTALLANIREELGMTPMLYSLGIAEFQYARPILLRLREAKKALEA